MTTVNLFLLIAALFLLLIWAVPDRPVCWLPADAPTRGMYSGCWTVEQLWV